MRFNDCVFAQFILFYVSVALNLNLSFSTELDIKKVYRNYEKQQRRADDTISSDFLDDSEYEERYEEGIDLPSKLLLLDNDDAIDKKRSSSNSIGILSAASAKIGTFSPLDCNPSSWTDCSTLVSNNLPSENDPLVIPCGQCYIFDMDGNVTLNGLNIEGKLLFPFNHQAVISTPYVIVQGEVEITVDHTKISPENIGTKFILTGTNNVYFKPTKAPNKNVCPGGGQCNIGVKPFVIAGGKVNLNAMPESCASHSPILQKKYTDPEYNFEDFPHFTILPEECPTNGTSFISYNFDDGDYGNWTGRAGSFMEVLDDGSVKVINRKVKSRGPHLDITPIRADLCLVPDQEYLFVAR